MKRCRKYFGATFADIVRIAQLEKAIKESQFIAEESERRYDETNKRVEVFDSDLERTYDRADSGEAYTFYLVSI